MSNPRVPLYDRLPEIYRIRDEEQEPRGQLRHYLALVEEQFGEIYRNIEALYHDLFIDTCDDWVIPYIGDLLGVSHLSGEAWTLRADVADTIALRRRKGTLASIERLTYNLTQWGVHCVELRENLLWTQHLNHQRPDEGGEPPYSLPTVTRFTPVRGGTVTLRDPAMLSLLDSPFDPFAHVADLKPATVGQLRYNLPNLAIFWWRLEDYRVPLSRPFFRGIQATGAAADGEATHAVRFDLDPLGRPLTLFNTYQFDPDRHPPEVTAVDQTPGPMPAARLTQGSTAGRPDNYLAVDTYDPEDPAGPILELSDVGLQLHLPEPEFAGEDWPHSGAWTIRGANLCGWEQTLAAPLQNREIVVDPVIGRLVIGVGAPKEAAAVENHLLVTYTYAAVGPVGAHPVSFFPVPEPWQNEAALAVSHFGALSLNEAVDEALRRMEAESTPALIEIRDSLIHELDLEEVSQGTLEENGGLNILLSQSLLIRAAAGERPILKLKQPLRFRPREVAEAENLLVRLEGLFVTRDDDFFPEDLPLIARAAVNRLEILQCTLDPGGHHLLDGSPEGTRAAIQDSLRLREPYGFSDYEEENLFDQTPEIIIQRSITGPLLIDTGYQLVLTDSIVDAGQGTSGTTPAPYYAPEPRRFAVSAAGEPATGWGPPTLAHGVTVFGRMRVQSLGGRGGLWVQPLEVLNNQTGCVKFSYFSGRDDRLPPHHACVTGREARLRLVSEIFGRPGYGQLARNTDFHIRERGPRDDAMGAWGFLLEAHKWRNLKIRYREFMPVGVRPLLIMVT